MVRILEALETYAKENHVPIMMPDGIEFLTTYIKDHQYKSILEIGTAIGYSAIKMALVDPEIQVTTIERDEVRYQEAIQNIHDFGLEDQITVILGDALEVRLTDTFDCIFIDAAKAQYIKFFEQYSPLLDEGGVIVSDNLNFHGLTHTTEPIESRNLRQLVKKLNDYIVYLTDHQKFETTFYEIGDGISVSKRKES